MADVNKSVSIDYRADLTQLISKLKEMPGITEKEAKKMVSELSKQMKKAEKATDRAAKKNAQALKKMEESAQKTGTAYKTLRKDAANVDRIFGELAVALDNVHPALGQMAFAASDAASGLEAVGRVVTGMNPLFLGILATATLVGAAFIAMSDDAEEVAKATKKATEELEKLATIAGSLDTDLNTARASFGALQGVIDDLDLASLQAEMDIRKASQEKLDAQEQRIALLQEDVDLLRKAGSALQTLSDEEEQRLKILPTLHKSIAENAELEDSFAKTRITQMLELNKAQIALQKEVDKETEERARLVGLIDEAVKISDEGFEIERKKRKAEEEANKAKEAARDAERAAAEQARRAAEQARKDEREQLAIQKAQLDMEKLIRSANSDTLSITDKINLKYADQLAKIADIEKTGKNSLEAQIARDAVLERKKRDIIDATTKAEEQAAKQKKKLDLERVEALEAQMSEERMTRGELHQLQIDNVNLEKEAQDRLHASIMAQIQERNKELMTGAQIAIDSAIQAASIGFTTLEQERAATVSSLTEQLKDQDNKLTDQQKKNIEKRRAEEVKALNRAFKAQQAAAISGVIMSTAAAIMQAYAQLGPVGGSVATAGLTALGGVQISAIANEKPPALHKGGMIGDPAEVPAVLRSGEGVLTRQGVASIGGEEGLNEANRGQKTAGSEPVVVQLVMGGRVIESSLQRNQRQGGSMARALSSHAPAGRTDHYRSR